MEISNYDMIIAGILVLGAIIGYLTGFMALIRPIISLVISRYLFVYVAAKFTGMNEIKKMVMKLIDAGVDKVVAPRSISQVGQELSKTKVVMDMETMLSSYIASLLIFAATYLVVRLVVGLIIRSVFAPRNRVLYKLDKFVGLMAGFALSAAFLVLALFVIMSFSAVGSESAANILENIGNTVIYQYVAKFF